MFTKRVISHFMSFLFIAALLLVQAGPAYATGIISGNYISEFWQESPDSIDTTVITVNELSPILSGFDFMLDSTGSISGMVYEADGITPVADIYVSASGEPNYFASACSDASGQFTLLGLPLDVPIIVQASPPWAYCGQWSNYVQEFWLESRDPDDASSIVLDALNPDRPNVNFTLDQGGVISGTVYASDNITPLPNIAISYSSSNAVCTDENGDYEFHGVPFDLPHRVQANAYHDAWCDAGGDYISEFWHESPDSIGATEIMVTALSPVQENIDFTLDSAGSISGTVYEADGVTPIPNLLVMPFGNDYFHDASACTDSSGNYKIHNVPFGLEVYISAGAENWCGGTDYYTVEFWPDALTLNNASKVIFSASNPDMPGVNFTLDAAPEANSSNLYGRAWYVDDIIEADNWPIGTSLTLEIEDMTTPTSPDYSAETVVTDENLTWFNLSGQFDIKPGMFVVLSGASVTKILMVDNLTITNIDQDLDTITGTTAPNNWMWMFFADSCCRSTVADGSGVWTFDYSVPGAEGQPIADIGPGSSGAIHVPSGGGSTSVDWSIPTDYISGHIHQADGITPIENMAVSLFRADNMKEEGQACTGADGAFTFDDVLHGTDYKVVAVPAWRCAGQPEGLIREYWQDTYDWNQATVITLSESQSYYEGIVFNLEQGQTATQEVGTDGGTVTTSEEAVTMDIPAGAVSEEITFTITDGGTGYQVATDEGDVQAVTSTIIGPPGTTFNVPVTLTFIWPDANDDGIVDGTTIPEGTLYLSKDGLVLAGPCSTDPACDLDANTISVQVSSLSFFVVGPLVSDAPAALGKIAPVNSANNISLFPMLTWQTSADATGYQYCIDTTNDNACASWVSTGSNTSVSLSGLNPNTTYYWQVRATNADGTTYANGLETAFWSFTTGEATATFPDVPTGYWAWAYVERLYNAGLTGGYPDGTYRPANTVTRAEMAIFLMKGMNGPAYTPPTVSPTFTDTDSHWAANWIEALKTAGLTGGYPDGTYRPNSPVTRAEMAIFLLKAMNGAAYSPPVASPTFSDTAEHWAANWIEALKAAGITSGYPDGTYRPGNYVTRAEMAVFLVKAFGLP